ncbi:MAG TPA: VanZ family protein [Candidatus Limnocylindrales bacterium]|nr:VanZ family protein [Candidatus Limnocylindrales bacterium]
MQWLHVWLWTLALLPVAVLAVVALARLRPSGSWRLSLAEVGMVYLTLPWLWMILTPVKVPPDTVMTHWVPFEDLKNLFGTDQFWVQFGGNLGVFFALGALAPVRTAALVRPWRLLALGAGCSLVVEVLQRLFVCGRVFSVDDVLLNAVGCLLGGIITYRWWRRAP